MLNAFCGSQCIYLAGLFVTFVPCAPVCYSIYSLTQMSSAKTVIQVPNAINFMIFLLIYTQFLF